MNWTNKDLKEALKNNPSLAKLNQSVLESLDDMPKENKYHNKPGWLDGIYFDSQAEMERYGELCIMKIAKQIKGFKVHPVYEVSAGIKYEADFEVDYWDHIEVEEVKGHWTKEAKLKVKLFREKYPDKILKIIRNGVVEGDTGR